jgi:hypothetical protein
MGAACCNGNDGKSAEIPVEDDTTVKLEPMIEQQPAIPVVEAVTQQERAAPPQEVVVPEKVKQVEEKTPVVEEKPPPPLPAAALVRLVFSTADGEKSVDLKRRPIGLWFTKSVPMKVTRVGKEFAGGAAGIEEGWTMMSVNGEDISKSSMEYARAMAILDTHVKKLPEETSSGTSIDFVFTCSDGKDATFKVQWSPLGTKFLKQQMPITVTDAGLYGGLLGIRPGMIFKSVSGVDVSRCGSYDDVMLLLKKNMEVFPQLGTSSARLQIQVSCR